jgi:LysR family transcriptional regulator, transcriptional activator of the cysJI operon
MELRQFETFRVVMTTLNMTMGAKQLHLSPAAVSLQIKQLSEELGTELFTCVGHRLIPTLAAQRLQQDLGPLTDAMRSIHEDFPPEIEHDTRPFVLASGSTTLIYQLRRPLSALRRRFPRNDIQTLSATTPTIVRGLECRQVDLGIVSLPLVAPSIQVTPLFRDQMLVVMQARTAKSYSKKINLRELSNIPMILYSTGTTERTLIDEMARHHGVSLHVAMEVDCTESIKKLVEAGFGASILPEKALAGTPRLRKLEIEGARLFRELALAIGQSVYSRKLTTEIAEYLQGKLGNQ